MKASDLALLDDCVGAGGVALFGADTVYGLACDAQNAAALQRIYDLKGRPSTQPSAVMFFSLDGALAEAEGVTRAALAALLPGPLTLLVPNPAARYPLAGGGALGIRVPLPGNAGVTRAFLQTSANLSGGPEARRLADVEPSILAGVDLVLDGGELPGIASTVVDLTQFAQTRAWQVLREGAVSANQIDAMLGSVQI